jgi:hypothetical protein
MKRRKKIGWPVITVALGQTFDGNPPKFRFEILMNPHPNFDRWVASKVDIRPNFDRNSNRKMLKLSLKTPKLAVKL